jgi:hypothetical protein
MEGPAYDTSGKSLRWCQFYRAERPQPRRVRKALITGHERGSQFSAGRILRPLRRCHYAAETFTLQGLI